MENGADAVLQAPSALCCAKFEARKPWQQQQQPPWCCCMPALSLVGIESTVLGREWLQAEQWCSLL
jgi:hypothetical protein